MWCARSGKAEIRVHLLHPMRMFATIGSYKRMRPSRNTSYPRRTIYVVQDWSVISLDVREVQSDDVDRPGRIPSIHQEANSLARADGAESFGDDVGVAERKDLSVLIVSNEVGSEIADRPATGWLPITHPPEPLST